MINGIQAILARSLLGLGRKELEALTGVSESTIRRIEDTKYEVNEGSRFKTLKQLKNFFERKGIEFIDENGKVGLVVDKKQGIKLEKERAEREKSKR